jgi:hypothetical protein
VSFTYEIVTIRALTLDDDIAELRRRLVLLDLVNIPALAEQRLKIPNSRNEIAK